MNILTTKKVNDHGSPEDETIQYQALSDFLDALEIGLKDIIAKGKSYFSTGRALAKASLDFATQLGEFGLTEAQYENAIAGAVSSVSQIQMAVSSAELELVGGQEKMFVAALQEFVKGPLKSAKTLRSKADKCFKDLENQKKKFSVLVAPDRKEPAKPQKIFECASEMVRLETAHNTAYQKAYCALTDINLMTQFDFLERLRSYAEAHLKLAGQAFAQYEQIDPYMEKLEKYSKHAKEVHQQALNYRSSEVKALIQKATAHEAEPTSTSS